MWRDAKQDVILIVPPRIELCKVDETPLIDPEALQDAYLNQLGFTAECNAAIQEQHNWVEKQEKLYKKK